MPNNIIDKIRVSGTDYTLSATTSGVSVVEVTQAEYDELPSSAKTDTSKMYVITDAQAGDLSQYWTSAQTNSAITEATSGKVDSSSVVTAVTSASTDNEIPTAKAVFDAIPTGGTGGGKAIEAGRGISVATGETADTVSFNLPISAGTGTSSIVGGQSNSTQGNYSFVFGISNTCANALGASVFGEHNSIGYGARCSNIEGGWNTIGANAKYAHSEGCYTTANTSYSHTEGFYTIANNSSEHASGSYNVSHTGSTDADKTLFSVGNGTADNARHNAFEIRQNGDIYLSSGGTDIKLQDHLGGGGGGGMTEDDELLLSTALTDLNDRKIDASEVKSNYQKKGDYATKDYVTTALEPYETKVNVEQVEEVTAYALNDLNDRLGGLKITKITESEYAALTTKDENTLYIVVADPS